MLISIIGSRRGRAVLGVVPGPLDVVDARRRRASCPCAAARAAVPGQRLEAGQLAQRQVELERDASHPIAVDLGAEVVRQVLHGRPAPGTSASGRRSRPPPGARYSSPSPARRPAARPSRDSDALDLGAGPDLGAGRLRGAPRSPARRAPVPPRTKPHSPREPPRRPSGGGAARTPCRASWAGRGADHAVRRQRRLQRLRLEPVVQEVGDAGGEDRASPRRASGAAAPEARPMKRAQSARSPPARRQVGRRLQQQRLDERRRPGRASPRRPGSRSASRWREAGELVHGSCAMSRHMKKCWPSRQRREVGRVFRQDLVAVARQIQVANDLLLEQRDQVRRRRDPVARAQLLGDGGAAQESRRSRTSTSRPAFAR